MPDLTLAGYALMAITAVMAVLLVMLLLSLVRLSRSVSGVRAEQAESTMMSAVLQETLTRLRAEERAMAARAEASERLASQIITGVGAGLIVVDRQGGVQIVNPAAQRILNLESDGTGMTIDALLVRCAPLARVISETLETGVPVARLKLRLDGRPSHIGVSVSRLSGTEAAVCLFSDLTEVVELEEQLRLKEALAGVGELTAGLAHEFRNGLATIHGYARLLDPARLPEPYQPYVEGIRQETTSLGEVVANFLNFARPQAQSLVPIELRAVVDRAVADLPVGDGRVVIDGTFGRVLGDEVLLRQAISNLVRNGLEACVAVGVTPTVVVTGASGGSLARITIEDNGPGIAPDALGHIFKPFVTTKGQGTGLGLAIVQKVIVSHNGRVSAENRGEGGARFRVQLPLVRHTQ